MDLGLKHYLLTEAIDYYGGLGYQHIETPWLVRHSTALLTTTADRVLDTACGSLVGSAEQGFLELALQGKLDKDKFYMSSGPCFRPLDAGRSELHRSEFFKLELFCLHPNAYESYDTHFIRDARNFFKELTDSSVELEKTDEGYDLTVKGVEVGSYGGRHNGSLHWTYGTGLALPRFTQACELK